MGCGASATIQPSPLEHAILQEDLNQLNVLLQNTELTSVVRTPVISRDVGYSTGHVTSQWNSPLVVAARVHSLKVMYFLLNACPDIESEIKREALMCILNQGKRADSAAVRLLVLHGADIRSPLRLCQSLKLINFNSTDHIKELFCCLLNNCDKSNRSVMHGALLTSLCSQSVRIRAHVGFTAGLEYVEWLFLQGVQASSYWETYLLDTCICDDINRLFRPTSVAMIFARALTSASLYRSLMISAQLFEYPHEDLIKLLEVLYYIGCFSHPYLRLTTVEKRTLIEKNHELPELTEVLETLEMAHRHPPLLSILSLRTIRMSFLPDHNPLSGTKILSQQIYLPQNICDFITIK